MLLLSKPATLLEDPTLYNLRSRASNSFIRRYSAPSMSRASLRDSLRQPASDASHPRRRRRRAGKALGSAVEPTQRRLPVYGSRGPASAEPLGAARQLVRRRPPPRAPSRRRAAPGTDFRLPSRAPDATPAKVPTGPDPLGWTFPPPILSRIAIKSDPWNGPSDINYSLLYSLFSYRLAASLDTSAAYGDFFSSSLGLSYADQSQQRPYLNNDGSEQRRLVCAGRQSLQEPPRRRERQDDDQALRVVVALVGTSLSWDMDSTIYGYKYDSTSSTLQGELDFLGSRDDNGAQPFARISRRGRAA